MAGFLCTRNDLKTAPTYLITHKHCLCTYGSYLLLTYVLRCCMAVEVEVEHRRLTLLSHRGTCLVTVTHDSYSHRDRGKILVSCSRG